jgi:large subunit ribosomal protein L35
MPKLKTRKAILKRLKITKTGKVLRGSHGSRHRMFHKDKRRIRRMAEPKRVTEKQARVLKSLINQ